MNRTFIIVILILFILSCDKTNIDGPGKLGKVYKNGELYEEFFYDREDMERYILYIAPGTVSDNIEFEYDGGKVVKLDWGDGHYIKYEYNGDLWTEENEFIQQSSFPQLVSYTHRQYAGGNIYEKQYIPDYFLQADILRILKNGNEIKTVWFSTYDGDTTRIIYRFFDNFNNPYRGWLPSHRESFNLNNILRTETHTFHKDSVGISEIIYNYTYNEKGYPVTMEIVGQGVLMEFEYNETE